MVRKIISIIFALAILTAGYFAWKRLNYWDRSVIVFKYDPAEQQFGRGMGRGPGGFDGRQGREVPDSIRMKFEQRGDRPQVRRGGEFHGDRQAAGARISMRTVPWYLTIFASFTVIVIYIEKGIKFIRKKKTDVPVPLQKQQEDCGID
jgi:hypothetical protein